MTTFDTQGTVVARGDGASPEVFTPVPQVTSINPVGFARSLIDVTNLSSTSREYNVAIKDGQEITLECQYDPKDAQQEGLRTDGETGALRNMQITLTDSPATVVTFPCRVTGWEFGTPIDDVYPLTVTLKPTGDLVFA